MTRLGLSSPFGGAPVFFELETESTMIDARKLAAEGFPSGTVAAAGLQTAGRGRFPDRQWRAEAGESLLFTVYFDAACFSARDAGLVPLKTGLALAEVLEREFGLVPSVKWPNDVLLGGKKTAGILAEVRDGRIFLGVGLNCLQKEFPPELRDKAVSVRMVSGAEPRPLDLLPAVLAAMKERLLSAGDWKDRLEERLHLRHTVVAFKTGVVPGELPFIGELLGVSGDGRLMLRGSADGEIRFFAAGEILQNRK